MIKRIGFLIIFFLFISLSAIAQRVIYSKVLVKVNETQNLQELVALGFDLDHYMGDPYNGISFFVTQEELAKLKDSGFSFHIEIKNYEEHYNRLRKLDITSKIVKDDKRVASGFDFGSMGGFYTLEEIGLKLDEMKQGYPDLITNKTSIGTSYEGRPIWMVKISDNPTIEEDEPAVYFDAIHHAREPLSMAVTINYMFWLLENYTTNPSVQYLVNNREIYFVPVINPDGYEYNRQTNPDGGGFWRKNRRLNEGGCIGVDLNRNYGFQFAFDDSCSSPDPCSGIYRGEEAFSEPETLAVRDFLMQIQPRTGFSTHSTAGNYLMPYGYNTSPPDFEIYSEWASVFLKENDYPYGVTFQMLGYTSCGTTRDYLHSEGIYAWTPEIGGSGFWPQQSEIFDLVAENVYPLFYQSWISGAYLDVQSHTKIGDALPGDTFGLNVEVKNIGVGAIAQNVTVQITSSVPEVTISNTQNYGNIDARTRKDNVGSPFTISIDPLYSESNFNLTISTFQDGVVNEIIEVPIYVGQKNVLFFDNAENGISNWVATGNGITWGIINDDSYSGVVCFGDSNGSNSENGTTNYFELNESFNLTTTEFPRLSFMNKHSLEINDNVNLQISINGGDSWNSIETFNLNKSWNLYSIDLSDYIIYEELQFRFRMQTNGFLPGDGFYFDDFEVSDYNLDILDVSGGFYNSDVIIYPNPFNNEVVIKLKNIENRINEVVLYDINGRKIDFNLQVNEEVVILKILETLASGVYFIKAYIGNEGIYIIKRIVKY